MLKVIIPTYNRLNSLIKTLESIMDSDYSNIDIFVIVDGNINLLKKISDKLLEVKNKPGKNISVILNKKRKDWIIRMNQGLLEEFDKYDMVMYASDDLLFPKHGISRAVESLNEQFPDGDGVVCLKQSHGGGTSAFGLMGKKFINRFPNKQVFCPDYIHYMSDTEMGLFAKSIKKYYFCEDVIIIHDRPRDETRSLARSVFKRDQKIWSQRRDKKILWGKDFGRVCK